MSLLTLVLSACSENNPLLTEWNTPFQIPPFEQIKPEHYLPAFQEAIKQHNAEIDAIINNQAEPDFENTILALDNSGELLSKVGSVFSGVKSIASSEILENIATEVSPMLSKHSSEINMNDALFKKVKAVYDKRESLGLDANQMRLLTETYKEFERKGANLPDDKKAELKELNTAISALHLKFGQNILKETAAFTLVIDNKDDLAGLSEDQIAAAALRAEKEGQSGKWIFGLDNPSIMPFLQSADNRELRIKIFDAYLNRCNNNNENDNKEVIKSIISNKLKVAQIFGYDNYAQYVLADRMAKTPEAVYDLIGQIFKPALNVAKEELKDIETYAKRDGITEIVPADWRYYAEKVKKERYNVSEDEIRPYFKIDNVRDGIFYVANKIYGITFTKLEDVPVPNSEAVAFECKDADGSSLGILFMDMFARPGEKRGGAWCGGYRDVKYVDGKRVGPLVTIVGNFTRPTGEKPALLSPDEVETYFHEFGHALASLLSMVKYSGLDFFVRDFVELPSQINEHWAFEPEVLKVYAKHYQTGETIPMELVEKIDKSGKYGQGFATTELLAASLLDMDYHVLTDVPADFDVLKFEKESMDKIGLISQIPPRYRATYFNHTFAGGYTAGYYSYTWAEVLDCDAYQAFKETGDIFNKEVATKFRKEILERGDEEDAMNLFLNFRGRMPSIDALLEKRGLK